MTCTREAIIELAKDDPNLARHIKWRKYGYSLEVQARLREQYDINVTKNEVTQTAKFIDSDMLTELAIFGLNEMEVTIREEFQR